MQLDEPVHRTVKLFSDEATGYCVSLPRWRYPVVCNTNEGVVKYDNYEGHWGEQALLDRLIQSYAVEKSILEARKQGYCVTEQSPSSSRFLLGAKVENHHNHDRAGRRIES